MSALIVGADKIDAFRGELLADPRLGISRTDHWTGRQVGDLSRSIPADTQLVVVVCTRCCHGLLHNVCRQAKKRGLPVIYCRHSVVEFRAKLERIATQTGSGTGSALRH